MSEEKASLSRRDFMKGAALVGGAATLAGLVGCGSKVEEKKPDAQEKAIPAEFTDGTYINDAISMHGKVTVKTVIEDGAIASVAVVNHRESYVLGEYAVEHIPARIVESQCIDVDATTGASLTSMAIKNAVAEAIKEAGGDPSKFEGYKAPSVTPKTVDKACDVAIMGGGVAGLMAAWEFAEAGKSVTIFEKMPFVGGCCPLTGGGIYTAETKVQKAWGFEECVERYSTFEKCIEFRQKQAVLDSPYYNPEMPYLTNTIRYSSKAVDKMFDIGVGFTPLDRAIAPVFSPGDFQVGTKYSIVFIEHYLTTQLGVEIIKECPVKSLKTDGDKIAGLTAEGVDGTTYNVAANVVILASGGYIDNDELMKEFQPEDMKFPRMGPPWTTGDGLLLAKDVGAAWSCMDWGVTSHYHGAVSLAEISYICYTIPGCIVDSEGNRFVDESGDYKLYLHKFREMEKPDFYWVFDASGYYGLYPQGNSYGIDYRFLEETGDLIDGENVDDLAEKHGLVNLRSTLEKVNDVALNGAEDELGNAKLPALDIEKKMYACKLLPTPYIAQGGVHVDLKAHVLREDGSTIKGLYAAGDVTGAVDNMDGHPYNIGLSQAFAWGLIAAETALAEW